MESRPPPSRRTGDSILTGGRRIRKPGSRSSSRGPRAYESVPLLGLLNDLLKFSKVLLRQETNPLRENLVLAPVAELGTPESAATESATDQMEKTETAELGTDDWNASCAKIKMELNRLVMWKSDVIQRQLTPALAEKSPLYSVLCESILSIVEVVKSRELSSFSQCHQNLN